MVQMSSLNGFEMSVLEMGWENSLWAAFAQELKVAIVQDEVHEDSRFNDLAMRLYRLQRESGSLHQRNLLRALNAEREPGHWKEINPVPQAAFKYLEMTPWGDGEAEACFRTSGTSQGMRGTHEVYSMDWYRFVSTRQMRRALYPSSEDFSILALLPSPAENPESSLSAMIQFSMDERESRNNLWAVEEGRVKTQEVVSWLEGAVEEAKPVLLVGTAFSWVHLMDALEEEGAEFSLPPGSRVMETGGFKGRSREISSEELYALMHRFLGVAPEDVINEYGMTELMSQLYTEKRTYGDSRRWLAPPWVRVRAVDPTTREDVPKGEIGVLALVDLANITSSMTVQTLDLGRVFEDGSVEVIGRARQTSPRGCSLDMEEGLPHPPSQTAAHPGLERAYRYTQERSELKGVPRYALHEICALMGHFVDALREWVERSGTTPVWAHLAEEARVSSKGLQEGLLLSLSQWSGADLSTWVKSELGLESQDRVPDAGSRVVLVIAASTLPSPLVFDVISVLLTGACVVVKTPQNMRLFSQEVASILNSLSPELGSRVRFEEWPGEPGIGLKGLLKRVDRVIVNGSDETVAAILRECSEPGKLIPRGTRGSIALFSRSVLANPKSRALAFRGLAQDILLWEQRGCLSPTRLFMEEEQGEPFETWVRELDGCIEKERSRMGWESKPLEFDVPWMGRLSATEVQGVVNKRYQAFSSLVVEPAENPEIPALTGGRMIVHSVPRFDKHSWPEWTPLVSTVVVAGDFVESEWFDKFMRESGASRSCGPGYAQGPRADWKHDGEDVLVSLTRKISSPGLP